MGTLSSYIREAMRLAEYEIIENDEPYYGEIPGLQGVWAVGSNLKECQEELESALEDWILAGLSWGHTIPVIAGIDLNLSKEPIEAT